jgi:hypothetical protein
MSHAHSKIPIPKKKNGKQNCGRTDATDGLRMGDDYWLHHKQTNKQTNAKKLRDDILPSLIKKK